MPKIKQQSCIDNLIVTRFVCALTALLFSSSIYATTKAPDTQSLTSTVEKALTTFNTPGMAIAVVKGDEVLNLSGFGIADLETGEAVDPKTYFRLASTSKAFTSASIAMLVDTQQLSWDDRVIDHLPNFRLADPYATREMTIRDLLTHRSGLGSGMGDSMLWPEPASFSREEIIHNLRYLTPQYSFRSRYAYSNVMYITAAEIVANKVGLPWDQFIDESLFSALNMDCYAGDIPANKLNNVAKSYGHNQERGIYPIPRNGISEKGLASAAAGGIVCNAEGMAKWLQHLIAVYQQGQQDEEPEQPFKLFSAQQLREMWQAQTVLSVSRLEDEWDNTVLKSYGMGWRIANFYGHRFISHTGTLSGYQAYVGILPDLGIGIAILNNGSNYGARSSVMQTLLREFVPESDRRDWVTAYQDYQDEREAAYLENYQEPQGSGEVVLDPVAYLGRFEDQWFGHFDLTLKGNEIRIQSDRMPMLLGSLRPFQLNTWVVEWDNQNASSDAFIHFKVNVNNQVTGFELHPYTVEERENHAWRDMFFHKSATDTD